MICLGVRMFLCPVPLIKTSPKISVVIIAQSNSLTWNYCNFTGKRMYYLRANVTNVTKCLHKKGLSDHINTAHCEKENKCTNCYKTFSSHKSLQRHIKLAHFETKIACKVCFGNFTKLPPSFCIILLWGPQEKVEWGQIVWTLNIFRSIVMM